MRGRAIMQRFLQRSIERSVVIQHSWQIKLSLDRAEGF